MKQMFSIKQMAGLCVAVLLASAGIYYAVLAGNTSEQLEPIVTVESANFSESQNLTKPTNSPAPGLPPKRVHEELRSSDEQTVTKRRLPPRLLQPADLSLEAVEEEFNYLERDRLLDGREFVRFDSQPLRSLKPGQPFTIVLPFEERVFTGAVGNIADFAEVKRLTGEFLNLSDDQINQFSMTVSGDGRYVAGAFSIGEETYTLEAKNGVGWVNKSSTEYEFLDQSEQEQTINFAPYLINR